MLEGFEFPVPANQVWMIVCVHDRKELIEIRGYEQSHAEKTFCFYRKESTLGYFLTDFLYADLSVMGAQLSMLKDVSKSINLKTAVTESFRALRESYDYWQQQGPIFAPFMTALLQFHIDYEKGEQLSMQKIKTLAARYQELQAIFKGMAACFTEEARNPLNLYFRGKRKQPDQYPTFSYGGVELMALMHGGETETAFFEELGDMAEHQQPYSLFTAEAVKTTSLDDVFGYLFNQYLLAGIHFRTCKYCGKLFGVGNRSKVDYCNRRIEGSTKTCKETGAFRLYEQRTLENPAIREYKRSYKAHNARVRYGIMTKEAFSEWSAEARVKRDLCVEGKLSLEEFVAWLDSDKRTQ